MELYGIIVVILTIVIDVIIYTRVISSVKDFIEGVIVTIFGLPLMTIMAYLIASIIALVICLVFSGLFMIICKIFNIDSDDVKYSRSSKPVKEKKSDCYIDRSIEARCNLLIDVFESLSNTEIRHDRVANNYISLIKINKITSQDEVKIYCDSLENYLVTYYKSTVAMTDTGYRWLKSIGKI